MSKELVPIYPAGGRTGPTALRRPQRPPRALIWDVQAPTTNAQFVFPTYTRQPRERRATGPMALRVPQQWVWSQVNQYRIVPDVSVFVLTGEPTTALAVTMPADVATFAETGQPVGFGVAMLATTATFTETGQAATLAVAMPAAVGVFAEAGQAATLAVGMPAGVGSFVETGAAAPLTAQRTLSAATGSYAVAGQQTTLAVSQAAAMGAFALTGPAVGFGIGFPAAVGTFTDTGEPATLAVTMAAGVGAFAETGADASLVHGTGGGFAMGAASATFAETGAAAGLYVGRRLAAAQGAISETGEPTAFLFDRLLPAQVGTFTETTFPAVRRRAMPADGTTCTLTGAVAGLNYGRFLTAVRTSFAVTRNDAGLRAQRRVAAVVASLVLVAPAIALVHGHPFGVAAGTYTFVYQPATLLRAARIITDVRALQLYAPPSRLLRGYGAQLATGLFVVTGTTIDSALLSLQILPLTKVVLMSDDDTYTLGATATISAQIRRRSSDVLLDPATLAVTVKPPGLPEYVVTYPDATLLRDSVGLYHLLLDITHEGDWETTWRTTGPRGAGMIRVFGEVPT